MKRTTTCQIGSKVEIWFYDEVLH